MKTTFLLRAGALAALTLVGLAACSVESADSGGNGGGTAAATAPDVSYVPGVSPSVTSNSGNTDNPPPRDITGVECIPTGPTGPIARGALTNHSSGLSNYMIAVNFFDGAGTIIAQGTAFLNNVPGGADATWEANSLAMDVATVTGCEVVSVERLGV